MFKEIQIKSLKYLNIISIGLTGLNFILALTYKLKVMSLRNNTSISNLLQYEYLTGTLCYPQFNLQVLCVAFDILYYLFYMFFTKIFCKALEDENSNKIREKIINDNMFVNLCAEFFLIFMTKGISLGFQYFFTFEAIIEIKRILTDYTNLQSQYQVTTLNSILKLCSFIHWFLLITMIYIIWFYIVRITKHYNEMDEKEQLIGKSM